MSIRCGHCKGRHERAIEVWSCGQVHKALLPAQPVQEAPTAPLEPGFYRGRRDVFRLLEDRSWRLLLTNGRWSGPCAAPHEPKRMTVEEVAAEGRRVVRCIVCGIKLTKPESIARGMGDICASKV